MVWKEKEKEEMRSDIMLGAVLVLVAVFLGGFITMMLFKPLATGGGYGNRTFEQLFSQVIAEYEEFGGEINPQLVLENCSDEFYANFYANITAWYSKDGKIHLKKPWNWTNNFTLHVLRHEMCHYYFETVCDIVLEREFGEPFCEGYAISKDSVIYPTKGERELYQAFAMMPAEFFECGLRTCKPLECYENITGEKWT